MVKGIKKMYKNEEIQKKKKTTKLNSWIKY